MYTSKNLNTHHENEGFWDSPKVKSNSYLSKMRQNNYMELSGNLSLIFSLKMAPQTPPDPKSSIFLDFPGFSAGLQPFSAM